MPNKRITELTTYSAPNDTDVIAIVDVTDSTMAASGTDKKITYINLMADALTAASTAETNAISSANAYTDTPPTFKNVATTPYTFVLTDAGNVILQTTSASAQTLTIPTNASVAFPVGSIIEVLRVGTGVPTFSAAGGVTLQAAGSAVTITNQYATATLIKRATDTWALQAG